MPAASYPNPEALALTGPLVIERGDITVVPAADAIFIGRVGLTLRLGMRDVLAPAVMPAIPAVAASCRAAGRMLGLYFTDPAQAPGWQDKGASFFVVGMDTSFLTPAVAAQTAAFRATSGPAGR